MYLISLGKTELTNLFKIGKAVHVDLFTCMYVQQDGTSIPIVPFSKHSYTISGVAETELINFSELSIPMKMETGYENNHRKQTNY